MKFTVSLVLVDSIPSTLFSPESLGILDGEISDYSERPIPIISVDFSMDSVADAAAAVAHYVMASGFGVESVEKLPTIWFARLDGKHAAVVLLRDLSLPFEHQK